MVYIRAIAFVSWYSIKLLIEPFIFIIYFCSYRWIFKEYKLYHLQVMRIIFLFAIIFTHGRVDTCVKLTIFFTDLKNKKFQIQIKHILSLYECKASVLEDWNPKLTWKNKNPKTGNWSWGSARSLSVTQKQIARLLVRISKSQNQGAANPSQGSRMLISFLFRDTVFSSKGMR